VTISGDRSRHARAGFAAAAIAAAGAAALAGGSVSLAGGGSSNLGKTTLDERIVPASEAPGFKQLTTGAGEDAYILREEGVGTAQAGRDARRTALAYIGQLSDFQLADEESPARVEFIDAGPASAAWRPMEALNPQVDDAMIRQINAFAAASPVPDGNGARRAMDFELTTGDNADSQQRNETEWVRTLLEGGTLNPGSGVNPTGYVHSTCIPALPAIADAGNPQNYTGVQDYDDYNEGGTPQFYDPDTPTSAWSGWPQYPGLMDKAQQPFDAAGLDVPSYLALGNHDGLVQGNQAANRAIEDTATGCIKPMSPITADPGSLSQALGALSPTNLLGLLATDPGKLAFVPPDPGRQFVSKQQYREIFLGGTQDDGHGFGFVDPAELAASDGAASYYSFSPLPGMRFIHLDTVSEGGVTGPSADGNVDDPQFQWLEGELQEATDADELVVLFSHHAITSMLAADANVVDEAAGPCTAGDGHGHDNNPGCDVDPRNSAPVHGTADLETLLHQYPHVIAWIAGHSHVNAVDAFPAPGPEDGGFWSVRVAAEADWPQQTRLLDLFDNEDGTLSLFGTIIDHASEPTAPAPGTQASTMSIDDLASIGRTLAANDPQGGLGTGEGSADDRNTELLIEDPRRNQDPGGGGGTGEPCQNLFNGTKKRDVINGTPGPDRIRGKRGRDTLNGLGGRDCLLGGSGRDRLRGGDDADVVNGQKGADNLNAGAGEDTVRGGRGRDRVNAADGEPDVVRCGSGVDRAVVDPVDKATGCDRIRQV
jgi:metallophosphoesterase (TIGR03767 family)